VPYVQQEQGLLLTGFESSPVMAEALHRPKASVAKHPVHVCEEVSSCSREPEEVLARQSVVIRPHTHHAVNHLIGVTAAGQGPVAEGFRVHLQWHRCLRLKLQQYTSGSRSTQAVHAVHKRYTASSKHCMLVSNGKEQRPSEG
jgi:hypothetical protein